MELIHASSVEVKKSGVLILGPSGSGKSDLALRLIENKNAVLVSDDQTVLEVKNQKIYIKSAPNIEGLLEVRGVGVLKMPYCSSCKLSLVVCLSDLKEIERLPEKTFFEYENIKIPLIKLYAFEASATDKIVVKLKAVLEEEKEKA